jgi:hypothetical protein
MESFKPDYIPGTGEEFRLWLNNFIARLRANAGALGIAEADVDKLATLAVDLVRIQTSLTVFKQIHMSYSAVERLFVDGLEDIEVTLPSLPNPPAGGALRGGINRLIVRLVDKLKHSPNYTEALGSELGILPPNVNPDVCMEIGPYKFKDGVLLVMWKRGHPFTAVEFFLDNGNGRGFVSLGVDHHPPVAIWDKLPHHGGKVRIKAQGYVDNKSVGAMSAELEIHVPAFLTR